MSSCVSMPDRKDYAPRISERTVPTAGAHLEPQSAVRPALPIVLVCLVGLSLDILGGQAVPLAQRLESLQAIPGIEVGFVAVNPRLPVPSGCCSA